MEPSTQAAALKAARLAAGLPAVAPERTQLRRAKSDRQEGNRRTTLQASDAYLDLQNRFVLKRAASVQHARKPLQRDDASSTTTRSWSPPPPPYSGRPRSSTTSTTRTIATIEELGERGRPVPPPPLPARQDSTSTTTSSTHPVALRRLTSETSAVAATDIAGPARPRPSSSYHPSRESSAPATASTGHVLQSNSLASSLASARYPVSPLATHASGSGVSTQPRPSPASRNSSSSTQAASDPNPVQGSLLRHFSRRRSSGRSVNDGTCTPPTVLASTIPLPSTPEAAPIQPPSFPSPEQMQSLDRRHSLLGRPPPMRTFTPPQMALRARSNSAPRAAVGARRNSSYTDFEGRSVRGSIYEEDESPYETVPPVPALPATIPAAQSRPRPATANIGRLRPQSAVVVDNAGMSDWRAKQNSIPSFPVTSPALLAARLSVVPEQHQHRQLTQELPQQERQSTMYIGDSARVEEAAGELARSVKPAKQTRFADEEPVSTPVQPPTAPSASGRPTTAQSQTMIIGDDENMPTRKSKRKSFMSRSKGEDGKCSMM